MLLMAVIDIDEVAPDNAPRNGSIVELFSTQR
jgi:hypothetical protein